MTGTQELDLYRETEGRLDCMMPVGGREGGGRSVRIWRLALRRCSDWQGIDGDWLEELNSEVEQKGLLNVEGCEQIIDGVGDLLKWLRRRRIEIQRSPRRVALAPPG